MFLFCILVFLLENQEQEWVGILYLFCAFLISKAYPLSAIRLIKPIPGKLQGRGGHILLQYGALMVCLIVIYFPPRPFGKGLVYC